MAISAQQAYNEIKAYIDKSGEPYRSWYVGIASSPRNRLFEDHNVSEENGRWIYRTCSTDKDARAVEEALLKLDCDGDVGGGDESTTAVYAYVKTSNTNP